MTENIVEECTTYPSNLFPVTFAGGNTGKWRVERSSAISGTPLPAVDRIEW
jgi:hypothetical protein